jgi:hypothetical protein
MILQRLGIGTTTAAAVLLGSTSLLAGAPGSAIAQGASPDPGRALQEFLSRSAARRSETQPLSPILPVPGSPAEPPDFALVGVVIAGEYRLAVLEDTVGAQLLPVGAWLASYQIIDVQADRVTLEGHGGKRVTVRLGGSGLAPSDERTPRAEGREPSSAAAADPGFDRDKEQRQAKITEETARNKARAWGEGTPAPGPAEAHPAPRE